MNPQYIESNYRKHSGITVHSKDYQIFQKNGESVNFTSNLLAIFWHRQQSKSLGKDAIVSGRLKIRETTPLGAKMPLEYELSIAPSNRDKFVQFISIPNTFPYTAEILQPESIERSLIEIWEFLPDPYLLLNMSGTSNESSVASVLIESINASNAQVTDAVNAANTNNQNFTNDSTEVKLPNKFPPANAPSLPVDPSRRKIVITNLDTAASVKVFIKAQAEGTPYPQCFNYFSQPIKVGQCEIDEPMCRGEVWLVSSIAESKVAIATTKRVASRSV